MQGVRVVSHEGRVKPLVPGACSKLRVEFVDNFSTSRRAWRSIPQNDKPESCMVAGFGGGNPVGGRQRSPISSSSHTPPPITTRYFKVLLAASPFACLFLIRSLLSGLVHVRPPGFLKQAPILLNFRTAAPSLCRLSFYLALDLAYAYSCLAPRPECMRKVQGS